jgi:DNA polymerase-1
VLYDIEEYGFLVDVAMLNEDKEFLLQRNHELEEVLFDAIGYRFNWRSNPQLSKALYEDIGHPRPVNPFVVDGKDISRNPQAGKYNKYLTSTFILTEKAHHPLGELVASIRETAKLVSTIDGLMKLIDPANVVHTNFNLTGTRTGRLASGKPNLQNVASEIRGRVINQMFSGDTTLAIRSGAFNLRKSFTARPGKILVSVDYKQMEMRMFGILSGDPFMLKSLSQGRDIHADIAEACWGIRDETHREWAKSISFGLIYGMTMGSLRFRLDLTFEMAKKITDDYWRTFPRIKPWLKQVQVDCKEAGYLRYWSGRMWREEDDMLLYKGANALIQGGCADLMSIAAIRVHRWLKEQGEDFGHIVNLVHDEIIFEVAEEDVLWAAQEVAKIMLVEDLLGIPFLNDIKIGYNYGEMEKLSKLLEEEKSNDSK